MTEHDGSGPLVEQGRFGPIEWAAAARPSPGEEICGDRVIAVELDDSAAVFGVIDGLGHGADAAAAGKCAAQVIDQNTGRPLDVVMGVCHRQLTNTRGAAITLARIGFHDDTLQWIGVGNVSAHLFARATSGVETQVSARLAAGIVGYRMPEITVPETIPIRPGNLLIIASDGIDQDHLNGVDFAAPAGAIAAAIVTGHSKAIDDASVLVARHRGLPA
jgi:negative regulator of sigma-B (phosphoserine phosphatase)